MAAGLSCDVDAGLPAWLPEAATPDHALDRGTDGIEPAACCDLRKRHPPPNFADLPDLPELLPPRPDDGKPRAPPPPPPPPGPSAPGGYGVPDLHPEIAALVDDDNL